MRPLLRQTMRRYIDDMVNQVPILKTPNYHNVFQHRLTRWSWQIDADLRPSFGETGSDAEHRLIAHGIISALIHENFSSNDMKFIHTLPTGFDEGQAIHGLVMLHEMNIATVTSLDGWQIMSHSALKRLYPPDTSWLYYRSAITDQIKMVYTIKPPPLALKIISKRLPLFDLEGNVISPA